MALLKEMDQSTGVSASYWRISRVEIVAGQYAEASLLLYIDATARSAGKDPVASASYRFSGSDNPCTTQAMAAANPFVLLYDKIKTLPAFADAQDV